MLIHKTMLIQSRHQCIALESVACVLQGLQFPNPNEFGLDSFNNVYKRSKTGGIQRCIIYTGHTFVNDELNFGILRVVYLKKFLVLRLTIDATLIA